MNRVFLGLVVFLISFIYGGLYNEMYLEGLGFTLENILWAILGALLVGFIPFLVALILSYIYYNTRNQYHT